MSPIPENPQREDKNTSNVIQACRAARVKRLVQSTVAMVNVWAAGQFVNFSEARVKGGYWHGKAVLDCLVREAPGIEAWADVRLPHTLDYHTAPLAKRLVPTAQEQELDPRGRQARDCTDHA